MKKLATAGLATIVALHATAASAAVDFGSSKVITPVKGDERPAEEVVQVLVGRAMTLLAIIAVLYLLWGGFNILTAGGDEEKVKKGRTIIIQACIGLVVIFLANSIVQFVLRTILGAA